MRLKHLATALFGLALTVAAAQPAGATTILTFSQANDTGNTLTIDETGGVTTMTTTDTEVSIGTLENSTSTTGYLDFSATSTTSAQVVSGVLIQSFSGSFSICDTAAGCTATSYISGVNYLSGTFTGTFTALIGNYTGTLAGSQPTLSVSFYENGPITSLDLPRAVSFSFTNWATASGTGIQVTNNSLADATANISGNFSANAVPEPASMLLLGSGLLGLAAVARRRRSA